MSEEAIITADIRAYESPQPHDAQEEEQQQQQQQQQEQQQQQQHQQRHQQQHQDRMDFISPASPTWSGATPLTASESAESHLLSDSLDRALGWMGAAGNDAEEGQQPAPSGSGDETTIISYHLARKGHFVPDRCSDFFFLNCLYRVDDGTVSIALRFLYGYFCLDYTFESTLGGPCFEAKLYPE